MGQGYTYKNNILFAEGITIGGGIYTDAGGRMRTSQLTTLGDYKIINQDRPYLWSTASGPSGTGTFDTNKYLMSASSGSYIIRQTKFFHPYFSGKSQVVECTFDNFQAESGSTKRVGYFSSNTTAPFSGSYDGFWLENDGINISLRVSHMGTSTLNIPITSWDNYGLIQSYDWSKFTVIMFDFLWLGGAILRLWLKTDQGFVLCHTFNYSGTSTDTFTESPNKPIRYEVRSNQGAGSLRFICAQCATEGSVNESGNQFGVSSGFIGIPLATVGTNYLLLAIRKSSGSRDLCVKLEDIQYFVSSIADQLNYQVLLNPVFSVQPRYFNSGFGFDWASGSSLSVASSGALLASGFVSTNATMPPSLMKQTWLTALGSTINGTEDVIALCGTPITTGVTSFASAVVKVY